MENWFSTTLSAPCGSTDTTFSLTNTPTPTEGYLIIDPNNTSTREVIHYTSVGSGTITIPGTGDRGLDGGNAATSHAQGTAVVMNYTSSHFNALKNGYAFNSQALATIGIFGSAVIGSAQMAANAIATTSTFSSSVLSAVATSYSNGGSAGGTFNFANVGGRKELYGFTNTQTIGGAGPAQATVNLNLPLNFFTNIYSIVATADNQGNAGLSTVSIYNTNASIVNINFINVSGTANVFSAYVYIIGN